MARKFSGLTLEEVMPLVPATDFTSWLIDVPPRPPSDILQANLHRLRVFDTQTTEAAKLLTVDLTLAEVVSEYPSLKIWKGVPLSASGLTGIADYLLTPQQAYVAAPLLCAVEAKRDDFFQGRTQCVGEMVACRDRNRAQNHDIDIYGIVSNGYIWQFYRLSRDARIWESPQRSTDDLAQLLGILNSVIAACAANLPAPTQGAATN